MSVLVLASSFSDTADFLVVALFFVCIAIVASLISDWKIGLIVSITIPFLFFALCKGGSFDSQVGGHGQITVFFHVYGLALAGVLCSILMRVLMIRTSKFNRRIRALEKEVGKLIVEKENVPPVGDSAECG